MIPWSITREKEKTIKSTLGISAISAIILIFALSITVCKNETPLEIINPPTFTVFFESNGGTEVAEITGVTSGEKISEPSPPVKPGYECKLAGWYKNEDLSGDPWNFGNDTVTGDMTLHAKWTTYEIGDEGPCGGIIYYVNPEGFNFYIGNEANDDTYINAWYLEAAAFDEGAADWGANGIDIDGSFQMPITGEYIGYGRRNTKAIINVLKNMEPPETGKAAQLCAEKPNGGEYGWFLPSSDELNELYKVGGEFGIPDSGYYWSSSQATDGLFPWSYAFYQNFSNGSTFIGFRWINYYNVRAVRAF